jgi:hypothetical protein
MLIYLLIKCGSSYIVYPGLSRTHGFFFAMGGFVTRDGHHPIVTEKQLAQYIEGIKEITEEDIVDKSKGDNLSKAWTFVQVGWFSAKYFARLKEHLPILALETATLGFAVIYGCTWWFWRKKPQDVSEAIRIDLVSGAGESVILVAEIQSNRSFLRRH